MGAMKEWAINIESTYGFERYLSIDKKLRDEFGRSFAERAMVAISKELEGIYHDGYDAACDRELGGVA